LGRLSLVGYCMNTIKTGDEVVVIAGVDKGHRGKVTKIVREKLRQKPRKAAPKGQGKVKRVFVEGMDCLKHVKANPNASEPGGRKSIPRSVHVSNVMLVDSSGKPSRVGVKTLEDGKKVRYFKTNGEVVDV